MLGGQAEVILHARRAADHSALKSCLLLQTGKLELFGGELVAVDSTKIKAQNSKRRNYSAAKLKELLEEIDPHLGARHPTGA